MENKPIAAQYATRDIPHIKIFAKKYKLHQNLHEKVKNRI